MSDTSPAARTTIDPLVEDDTYDFAAALDDQLCVPCILCNCQGCEACLPFGKRTYADTECACADAVPTTTQTAQKGA